MTRTLLSLMLLSLLATQTSTNAAPPKPTAVLDLWPELVGEHVAEVTKAKGVSEATLFVEVRTSAWLMELNIMKGEFLVRVNERLGDVPLERIVFVLAETS